LSTLLASGPGLAEECLEPIGWRLEKFLIVVYARTAPYELRREW
jgi:hypothetical protein